MIESKGLIEQHIHGAFGCDFMNCSENELVETAERLVQFGVSAFFPTVMTDDIDVIKDRILLIKSAMKKQKEKSARIMGVHLEGPFINPLKAGIHEKKYIQPLFVPIFKHIEDEIIKIVTFAPELDNSDEFKNYLKSKNIKLSIGHTMADFVSGMNQVTHLYNAMPPFHHRDNSLIVQALSNKEVYIEIIADSMHVNDEVLKITFKQKSLDKVLLISDALPLAHSDKTQHVFAGQKIYNKDGKLVNLDGVFAGSSFLLADIVKNLADKNILKLKDAIKCASSNLEKYHDIKNNLKVYWNDNNEIVKIEFI